MKTNVAALMALLGLGLVSSAAHAAKCTGNFTMEIKKGSNTTRFQVSRLGNRVKGTGLAGWRHFGKLSGWPLNENDLYEPEDGDIFHTRLSYSQKCKKTRQFRLIFRCKDGLLARFKKSAFVQDNNGNYRVVFDLTKPKCGAYPLWTNFD